MSIITAVLGVVFGGGSMFWINWKASRKKPELENQVTEATIEGTKVDSLDKYSDVLNKQIELTSQLTSQLRELNDKNEEIKSDLAQCQMAICRVALCPFREPERGLGDDWFKECKTEHKSIFDNSDFNEFLKNKGYVLKRVNKIEKD